MELYWGGQREGADKARWYGRIWFLLTQILAELDAAGAPVRIGITLTQWQPCKPGQARPPLISLSFSIATDSERGYGLIR